MLEKPRRLGGFIILLAAICLVILFSHCEDDSEGDLNQSYQTSYSSYGAYYSKSQWVVKNEVLDILNSTKVHEMWAPTIGQMVNAVFFNYEIEIEPFKEDNKYLVEISGSYNPNPDYPNLSFDGAITYLVDIDLKSCSVYRDTNNIHSAFLVHIVY